MDFGILKILRALRHFQNLDLDLSLKKISILFGKKKLKLENNLWCFLHTRDLYN